MIENELSKAPCRTTLYAGSAACRVPGYRPASTAELGEAGPYLAYGFFDQREARGSPLSLLLQRDVVARRASCNVQERVDPRVWKAIAASATLCVVSRRQCGGSTSLGVAGRTSMNDQMQSNRMIDSGKRAIHDENQEEVRQINEWLWDLM